MFLYFGYEYCLHLIDNLTLPRGTLFEKYFSTLTTNMEYEFSATLSSDSVYLSYEVQGSCVNVAGFFLKIPSQLSLRFSVSSGEN